MVGHLEGEGVWACGDGRCLRRVAGQVEAQRVGVRAVAGEDCHILLPGEVL